MALGDDLCADDDVAFAFGDLVDHFAQFLDAGQEIARQDFHARLRPQRLHLFVDAFHARPAGNERTFRLALWAGRRDRGLKAAMVAGEAARKAVLDQPSRTLRALEAVAASPAQRQGRIAAAVEKQQRLLAFRKCRRDFAHQQRRNPFADLGFVGPQINGPHFRKGLAGKARLQFQMPVASGAGIHHRLQRGRGGGQHHRNGAQRGAHHRHVAALIGDAVFLLEGAVVLLVDNDEAKIRIREV